MYSDITTENKAIDHHELHQNSIEFHLLHRFYVSKSVRGKLNTAADTGVPLLWNRFSSECADPGIICAICARKDLWWRQLGDNIWEAQQINLPSGQGFGVLLRSSRILSNIEIYPAW